MLPFAIFLFALFFLIYLRWRRLSAWDHFPGFKAHQSLPLLGHVRKLGGDDEAQLERLEELRRKFGPIFRLDFGDTPTIFICGSEQIKRLYKMDAFSHRAPHGVS